MADNAKKRKQASDAGPNAKRSRFPGRPQHHISTTSTKTAYPNGEVNVKNFLKSHENEIRSLESAMKAAKKGLSRRAFQDVPRELRRRTASHNPQRVPKRLRQRAKQEAKEDNTPITRGTSGSGIGHGKKKHLRKEGIEKSRKIWEERAKRRRANKDIEVIERDKDTETPKQHVTIRAPKASNQPNTKRKFPAPAFPATPPSRFRRRQRDKTWLPTHIWHTKRARITSPKEPLWRFAIPLAPVVKSYRLTHRAAAQRGAVAWDMSYMSTISLEGAEASIVGLLKGLHFAADGMEDPWQDRGRAKKWMQGTRVWEGWICEREAKPPKKIAYVTVIWCIPETEKSKRKAFVRAHPATFLQLWNEIIRIAKVQKPPVMVHDLRFEMGSIEIIGPAAAETLNSVLRPITLGSVSDAPQSVWSTLAPVTDAGSLPIGALLAFDVSDPRFADPPATSPISLDPTTLATLTELLVKWPVDNTRIIPSIFDSKARLDAVRSMPSQKSINRRKSACTLGETPEARPTDPKIPILLFVSRDSRSWTVMLPWKCVMPVWRAITRYPISTGGNPRFGGLKERRQVNYERSVPYFPYDHPGTDAGWEWERQQREARKHDWTKRPKGKRIEWSTIDLRNGRKGELGDPWACAWERLLPPSTGTASTELHSPLAQISSNRAAEFVDGHISASITPPVSGVFTVKITMVQRGTPTDCARVYRLPTNDAELRSKWLSLVPKSGSKRLANKLPSRVNADEPEYAQRRKLAQALLEKPTLADGPLKAGDEDYPAVPDEEHLIGFVTTGNYNLAEGIPTAVANLALHRLVGAVPDGSSIAKEDRICVVRQAGSTIGRLARWEVV
jgi:ribonuclease P/MRP protein subunit POP1